MTKRAVAVAFLLVLSLCGCNASAVANWTGLQPAVEPPNVETVTFDESSLEVPRDWERFDDSTLEDLGMDSFPTALFYPPYGGSVDFSSSTDPGTVEEMRKNYSDLAYECERDGHEVVANEIVGDDRNARGVLAYVAEIGDEKEENILVQAFVIEDGVEAYLNGGIPTSCTEAQRAEFNWVVNSLAVAK